MYKDKKKQREAVKKAVAKHREGITKEGITGDKLQGITLLHRSNGEDYNPDELLPDGRKRYLGPFSDGQVLDRLTVPEPNKHLPAMVACIRADKADFSGDKARRIALIGRALDKEVTGLDSQKVNLGSMERCGISGLTFSEIKKEIT